MLYFLCPQKTIKCLLIYPNPESALNEEAGRLLLEQYEDFSRHARMMTDIHAKPLKGETSSSSVAKMKTADSCSAGVNADKKKKEKKKALKRL